MNRFLVLLAVLVTVGAFGAIVGTASAHHGECSDDCGPPPQECEFGSHTVVDVAAYDEEVQVKDYFDFHTWSWVYKTIIVHHDAKTHDECNPGNCDNDLYAAANDQECNPTCDNGGITDPNICDPPVEVCVDGVVGTYPTSQAPEDTGDCGPASYCLNGQIVDGTEYDAANNDTGDCGTVSLCINGDIVTGTEYDLNKLGATNDCGPTRLCLTSGESVTVTEFEAVALIEAGATEGSCTPTEPPPPTVTTTVTQPQPEQPVSEVSPAVEEAVALPSAGYGETSSGFNWTALAAVAFIGLAGGTALVARRRS